MADEWSTSGVDLHLDLGGSTGRRQALEQALRQAVQEGRLKAGERLPSTRVLAAELGLSRGTVTAAYAELVAEGFLVAVTGSGTAVADTVRASRPEQDPGEQRSWAHDLTPGVPDVSAFPVSLWLRASRKALTRAPSSAFDYAHQAGRPELQQALTGYLGRARGVAAAPDRIVVTSGFVQALALLAQTVGRGPVAMEDPGLAFHRRVVEAHGRKVVPLPVDEHGARTDLLHTPAYDGVRLVVLTPAHQYPLGVPLAPLRRMALVEWAQARRGIVVEDDYDGEFRYDRQPVGALQAMAPDQVVYVGTASKTLAPALRLAWMVVPSRIRDRVVQQKEYADSHTESLGQLTLAELVDSHDYDRHVRLMRARYKKRRDQLAATGLELNGVAAGLQALVRVTDEDAVIARAAENDLLIRGMRECYQGDLDGRTQGIVVGFTRGGLGASARAMEVFLRSL